MWTSITERIRAASPDLYATLNPPAAPDEIATLERRVGAALPDAFMAYLATTNGQNDLGAEQGLHEMHRFLPAHEIVAMMDLMDGLFGDEGTLEHVAGNSGASRTVAGSPQPRRCRKSSRTA